MKKQFLTILTLTLFSFIVFAQNNINDYKYVIVPLSYNFIEGQDQYNLNSLTKFLFNKYGFTAFFQNEEFPDDLKNNRCMAMYTNVEREKGFLRTKLRIDLLDCNGKLVMSSKVGSTNEKEFAKAYNLALRDAFSTFQFINYKYIPSKNTVSLSSKSEVNENAVEKEKEIELLKEELKSLKDEKKVEPQKVVVAIPTVKEDESEIMEMNTDANQVKIEIKEATDVLYAQPIENGYQIIDTTPKIVMILLKTAQTNVFIVKDQDAIVYKEEGSWFMSRNNGGKVSIEALNIKF